MKTIKFFTQPFLVILFYFWQMFICQTNNLCPQNNVPTLSGESMYRGYELYHWSELECWQYFQCFKQYCMCYPETTEETGGFALWKAANSSSIVATVENNRNVALAVYSGSCGSMTGWVVWMRVVTELPKLWHLPQPLVQPITFV